MSIHPPLKPKPPLESSYNNLSNGESNAVITLHKPKQSYILLTAWPNILNLISRES